VKSTSRIGVSVKVTVMRRANSSLERPLQRLDRPVIVAYLVLIVLLFVVINLIVDICYSLLDPRVRLGEASR
jgi:ABC-type microcin C transport system permease subunit YejB